MNNNYPPSSFFLKINEDFTIDTHSLLICFPVQTLYHVLLIIFHTILTPNTLVTALLSSDF